MRALNKAAKSVGCTWRFAWAPERGVSVYRAELVDPSGRVIVSRISRDAVEAIKRLTSSVQAVQAEWRTA